MKKILRTVAAMLAVIMLVSCCAMSAFAEASSDEWTEADTEELMDYLEQTGNDELLQSYIDMLSGTDVSGADVSGSDAAAPVDNRKLRDHTLTEKTFEEFGFSVKVPDFASYADIYSDVDTMSRVLGTTANPDALFNAGYSADFSNYIIYAMSGSSNDMMAFDMMAVNYTESDWSRYIGNYSDLSAEEQEKLAASTDLIGMGTKASFREINGTPVLVQEYFDQMYNSMAYVVQAIVDGGMYEMFIQVADPGDDDLAVAEEIIESVKFSGVNPQRYGVASTCTTTWLFVLVAVLFVIVALLAFFLIRFSAFAKASGSEFNIIGFNFPKKN
ncbi:MAG: hypothetical protein E7554_01780 [Ruminococcaceae bacterium]|nr:hypothetical protein [Oscillospiraceae bacterium]